MTIETMLLQGSIARRVAASCGTKLVEIRSEIWHRRQEYLIVLKSTWKWIHQREKVTTRRILNHTAGLTVWGFPVMIREIPSRAFQRFWMEKEIRIPFGSNKKPGESWIVFWKELPHHAIDDFWIWKVIFPEAHAKKCFLLGPLAWFQSTFENPLPEKYMLSPHGLSRRWPTEVEGKIANLSWNGRAWTLTPISLILGQRNSSKSIKVKRMAC